MPEQVSNQGSVRVGGAMYVPLVLRDLKIDPVDVFKEAEINLTLFEDPDNLMPFSARIDLFNLCAMKTACKHFGLLVGQRCDLHIFGLVGFLVQHSPDVRRALENLLRYLHLHVRGAAPTLTEQGNLVTLGYSIHQPHLRSTDQLTDAAVATAYNVMRNLCGTQWRPVEVLFAHRKPEDVKPFRDFFQAPLRFNAEQNAVVFSNEWMGNRVSAADAELRRLLQKQIDVLEFRHKNFLDEVRSVLKSALLAGNANADLVAALFSIHDRTLSRRLLIHGTSFQKLTDECRFDIARQMLENSEMALSDIAAALNYSDASAFTRAFRRWSATTPTRWRENSKVKVKR